MLLILCGFFWLALPGCASLSPKPDPSRFFTLAPLTQEQQPLAQSSIDTGDTGQISLGLGPINFPGYLDRQELVSRVSQNRFAIAENDRWAEALADNFTSVLAQNLAVLLRTDRIILYPWPSNRRPAFRVEIDVLRFEPEASRNAQLFARWSVRDTTEKVPPTVRESRLTRPLKGSSTEDSVAALSEALGELSQEIAGAVRAIEPQTTAGSQAAAQ
jgi:uncharacterized lipoprotein YmbA